MGNVLSEKKRQQFIALGRLGWTLRRIETALEIRRQTAGKYLKEAGIEICPPGRWERSKPKPANEVTADPAPPASASGSKPANEVTTDPVAATRSRAAEFHELMTEALSVGRNATSIYQQLVDRHGYAHSYESVKRYVPATSASCASRRQGRPTPSSRSLPERKRRSTGARADGA